MTNIAFIGLGHMGLPMAKNLVKTGHVVKGYDIVPQAVEAFTKEGGIGCKDIASTVADAEIVITMLPEGKHVRAAFEGSQGIFNLVKPGTLIAECSTIDIETSRHIHKEAEEKGMRLIDAPVSGGVAGAESATITFMVGGRRHDFEALKPYLEMMGKTIIYCGEAGLGQVAKICNNLILGITMIGASEAFNLAERLGLDAMKFFEVASQSSAQCWSISKYCPAPGPVPTSPANHDYAPGFTASMMLKDLKLATDAAQLTSSASPLGTEAMSLYTLFCNNGGQSLDFSGILRFLRGTHASDI
ncbi:MAG: 3-hydroxyisobutyrate dehydrogenase [Alphaproteobacteria bacterium 41-28]|nr:MAG: 3-hydroxyisobutyrate dehydrogenase [Alphaproteobacteria bacterium 41-28]